jgi:UDP-glucose 4-epimerase
MKKTILVTGGTGYIGSHTAVELINNGFDVVIVDDLSNSQADVVDGIEKITGVRPHFENFNLCDLARTDALFAKYSIDAIIHFAAHKAVGESVNEPLKYYRNNLTSLLNLLECMKKYKVDNIVFSSSCTVYGQPDVLPVTEEAPIKKANSPYGNTKQICEEILQDSLVAVPELKIIALRYFNPVGAHPSALIGELPLGVPNNLVPFITQTAYGLRDELKVFGNDYNTPDGSCIRDYINVVDLASAHVVAISRLLENKNKKNFEVFNLGTGNGVSVLEIIIAFERATGHKLKYKIVGRRAGDVEQVWANTKFANEELGWKAQKSLDETLLSAWNWEKYIRSKQK